ncbi:MULTISPECIES: retropepsin-like aspartic protease [unclassified Arenibacter]|uniref:retropepsin-like aspartic protease n=1 Tax=unclassified Arenibacter TaxID=2615047 RepID=UPI000E348DD5|nr:MULTISPECIES: retropepsin-like aspartic protease [unclassified Arenibacter]MCM4162798.1 hypothetical protein [Arenibacter sp. A80]RFT56851.1 hypothetical protein D0S24_04255 [Arenibacter sp. P308M17]
MQKWTIQYAIVYLLFISQLPAQIQKVGIKHFLDNTISHRDYNISILENTIKNSHEKSLLLNKAVRFKMYIDAQEYASNIYSKNCNSNSSQIGITNHLINNTFYQGIENANFLFKIAEATEPHFSEKYADIFDQQINKISSLLRFTDQDCRTALNELVLRKDGIFYDDNLGDNVLSFNYIANPVDELLDGHYQEFSSLDSSNDKFFITLKIPSSWGVNDKNSFNYNSTMGIFQPYEKFLNGLVTVSIFEHSMVAREDMISQGITDNDIVDEIYSNTDLLTSTILTLTKDIANQKDVMATVYNNGNKKLLFYNSKNNLSKITDNELFDKQQFQSWNVITFHNGQIIKIDFSAYNEIGEINSFDYYSKVFFKIISSIKFKDINENILYLTDEQGMKYINADFNGLEYKFLLDTGASSVVINRQILEELLTNGSTNKKNMIGTSRVEIADGTVIICEDWLIPEIKVGDRFIRDVIVKVIDSQNSLPLFGMDGLSKLNVQRLNLNVNEIILKPE